MRRRELMRSRRELLDSLNHSRAMLAEREAQIVLLKRHVLHLSALVNGRDAEIERLGKYLDTMPGVREPGWWRK